MKLLSCKEEFFKSDLIKGENVVFHYLSPNIAKLFHVGHLRLTVIVNNLYNVYFYLGYKCIGVNHLVDWETQFGAVIFNGFYNSLIKDVVFS